MKRDDLKTKEDYKNYKRDLHEAMLQKQRVPYSIKRKMSETRIRDFYEEAMSRGLSCHVSVGGLDSITLGYLIREMGYTEEQIPFVSASSLEDISIQRVHKEMGCIVVKPLKSKVKVLQDEGFPVLSKRIANKIDTIANPTEKNKTVRHAIITVRVSGDECFRIIDQLLRCRNGNISESKGYTMKRGQFSDVDDVVVGVFRGPHSYTGEDSVEIYCHASSYIVSRILELLTEAGCRLAEAGEFTKRAYLNGKMDLAQAEAVVDVIASSSAAQHRVAMNQLRGGYSAELRAVREELLQLAALIELELDFSEEDVEFADRTQLADLLSKAIRRCEDLADSFKLGNAIRNGVPVAIVGAPNGGKSTLLNALLRDERAIVSDIPGTTRDTIEECCVINGVLFRFIDTAGIREASDVIEKLGIERAISKIREAEIVLGVVDCSEPEGALDKAKMILEKVELESQKLLLLCNKVDVSSSNLAVNKNVIAINSFVSSLDNKWVNVKALEISAKGDFGLENLREELGKLSGISTASDNLVTNARHAQALREAALSLREVDKALALSIPTDLVAEDLRAAITTLGSITGEISTDEILGEIFGRFCIGK